MRRGIMEFKRLPVFIVRQDSPAFDALTSKPIIIKLIKPGAIIPLSDEEFESFSKDLYLLEMEGEICQKSPG
tara:strand:+ start:800 stop:1015 length:216 start_codon:yes stop_codon:yes gene_type:complete